MLTEEEEEEERNHTDTIHSRRLRLCKNTAYQTIVHCLLEYATSTLDPPEKCNISALEKVKIQATVPACV